MSNDNPARTGQAINLARQVVRDVKNIRIKAYELAVKEHPKVSSKEHSVSYETHLKHMTELYFTNDIKLLYGEFIQALELSDMLQGADLEDIKKILTE